MTWDIATPDGSEAASQGDNRIRELKTDLQNALRGQASSGTEAVFPGSDTANPVFRYRGLKGTTAARPAAGQYGLYINETLNTIQRDNGSSWVDIATLIPSGTAMVFYQATAPVGWTKVTTQNDKALRVVSGGTGGSAGGTNALSSAAHTHSIASGGAHTHTLASAGSIGSQNLTSGFYNVGTGGSAAGLAAPNSGGGETLTIRSATTDSQGAHDHGAATGSGTLDLAYIDVIVCTKD